MRLEDEQLELLAKFVEAHVSAPSESRGSFIATWPHNDAQATFFHSRVQALRFQGNMSDAEALAQAGLLTMSSGSRGSTKFAVLPEAIDVIRERKHASALSPTSVGSSNQDRERESLTRAGSGEAPTQPLTSIERVIKKAKRHPVFILISLLVATVIGIGAFTDALDSIISFGQAHLGYHSSSPTLSEEEAPKERDPEAKSTQPTEEFQTEPSVKQPSTGPKAPAGAQGCVVVDIVGDDGRVLQDTEVRCGPKSAGVVTTSDITLRFTQNLEDIAEGVFPERLLPFKRLKRVDYQPLTDKEREAVRHYHASRSDFFEREWRRTAVTFLDGTVWEPVYTYDKCTFRSAFEDGDLDALKPISLLFTQRSSCN